MSKLRSIKVDPSQLKKRDLMKAKFSAKSAINALTEILADLEKDDGSIIDTRDVDTTVINVIAYVSALNTMNDYEP